MNLMPEAGVINGCLIIYGFLILSMRSTDTIVRHAETSLDFLDRPKDPIYNR